MPLASLRALKTAAWLVLFFQLLQCILFLVCIYSTGSSMKDNCSVCRCHLLETIYQMWCWWLDPLKKKLKNWFWFFIDSFNFSCVHPELFLERGQCQTLKSHLILIFFFMCELKKQLGKVITTFTEKSWYFRKPSTTQTIYLFKCCKIVQLLKHQLYLCWR